MKRISESFDFDNPNVESLVDGIVDEYKVVRQFSELLAKNQVLRSDDSQTKAWVDISYDDDIDLIIERIPGIIYTYWLHGTTAEDIRDALNRLIVDRKIEKHKIIQAIRTLVNDNSDLLESFDFEDDDTSIIDKRIEVYNPDKLYAMIADLAILGDNGNKRISELTINRDKYGNCDLYVGSSKSKNGKPVYDEIPLDSDTEEDIANSIRDYVNDFFLDDESQEEFIKVLRGIVLKYYSLLESFDFDADELDIESSIENRIEELNVGKLIDRAKAFVKLVNEANSKKLLNCSPTIRNMAFCGPDLLPLWTFGKTEMMVKLYPKNRGPKAKYSYAINLMVLPYLCTAENKLAAFSKFSDSSWKPLSDNYDEIAELNDLILYHTKKVQEALDLLVPETYESIERMIRLMAQRRISFVNYTNRYVSYRNGPYCVYDDPNPYGIQRIEAPYLQASWCVTMLDADPDLDSEEYLEKSLEYFNPFAISRPEYTKIMDALEDCWKPEYWPS